MTAYVLFLFAGSQIAALDEWIQEGWYAYESGGQTAVLFPADQEAAASAALSQMQDPPAPLVQQAWTAGIDPWLSPWALARRFHDASGTLALGGSVQPRVVRCDASGSSFSVTLPDNSAGAWQGVEIVVFLAAVGVLKTVTVSGAGSDEIKGGDATLSTINQSLRLIGGQAGEWLAL